MSPLVLVENEVTYDGEYDHWKDRTGVSYNYPNVYKNRVQPGRLFVYYRGVRRANNRRGQAEYFGVGRIGEIRRDDSTPESAPKTQWAWFCSIVDYVPFPQPVPAKVDGVLFETIPTRLGWRTGVREISDETFQKILAYAKIKYPSP